MKKQKHTGASIFENKRAFTLVELMVTMLIIATLTALMMQGYTSAIQKADGSKCMTNLRSLQRASELWSADHNGMMLAAQAAAPYGGGWPYVLWPYNEGKYIRCPTFVKKYHPELNNWGPGGYPMMGYSRSYFLVKDANYLYYSMPGMLTQITNPSKTVSFFDSENVLAGDAWGGVVYQNYGAWYYYLYPAHNNGFNLVFFDGHAEWVRFNSAGPGQGHGACDYPQFTWQPY